MNFNDCVIQVPWMIASLVFLLLAGWLAEQLTVGQLFRQPGPQTHSDSNLPQNGMDGKTIERRSTVLPSRAPDSPDSNQLKKKWMPEQLTTQATGPPRSDAGVGIGMLRGSPLLSAN